jgi:hypothetical protein
VHQPAAGAAGVLCRLDGVTQLLQGASPRSLGSEKARTRYLKRVAKVRGMVVSASQIGRGKKAAARLEKARKQLGGFIGAVRKGKVTADLKGRMLPLVRSARSRLQPLLASVR